MVIKSEFGIYKVLENHLRKTDKPLTCVDLYEKGDVKKFAKDANKVSDYLGHMWRRGLLHRFFAPKTDTSFARYAYTWKKDGDDAHDDARPVPPSPRQYSRIAGSRPNVEVNEADGSVVITFDQFTVTVRARSDE